MDTVLVTGGAGYIGSHVVLALRSAGRAMKNWRLLSEADKRRSTILATIAQARPISSSSFHKWP